MSVSKIMFAVFIMRYFEYIPDRDDYLSNTQISMVEVNYEFIKISKYVFYSSLPRFMIVVFFVTSYFEQRSGD